MLFLRVAFMTGLIVAPGFTQAPVPIASSSSASYLGVWIWEVDAARARELKLPQGRGLEVTLVRAGSPAEAAGLRSGDVLASYNGQPVDSIEEFSRMVRDSPIGRPVKIEFYRNGALQSAVAKIAAIAPTERPGPIPVPLQRGDSGMPDVPHNLLTWRSPLLGVDAEPIEGQLAAFFGVQQGVLVRSVTRNSTAEKSGMKAGDVIVRVGRFPVTTPAEITIRLRSESGPTAAITVMRDHKDTVLTVTF